MIDQKYHLKNPGQVGIAEYEPLLTRGATGFCDSDATTTNLKVAHHFNYLTRMVGYSHVFIADKQRRTMCW
jgi:hypothetical protein